MVISGSPIAAFDYNQKFLGKVKQSMMIIGVFWYSLIIPWYFILISGSPMVAFDRNWKFLIKFRQSMMIIDNSRVFPGPHRQLL